MLKRALSFVLLFSLLVLPSALFSQETSVDYWQEQREYYLQYPSWELPNEAIIAFLDQMEASEKELTKSQEQLNKALTISPQVKEAIEQLEISYAEQQNLLKWTGIAVVVLGTTTLIISLIK